ARITPAAIADHALAFPNQTRPGGNRWLPRKRYDSLACSPLNMPVPNATPTSSVATGQMTRAAFGSSKPVRKPAPTKSQNRDRPWRNASQLRTLQLSEEEDALPRRK